MSLMHRFVAAFARTRVGAPPRSGERGYAPNQFTLSGCCALLVLLSWLPVSFAATPAEELLRLVPEDVGFCVVVQDLRGHTTALLQSEFVKRLRASPFAAELAKDKEFLKLAQVEEHLQKHLKVNWTQL